MENRQLIGAGILGLVILLIGLFFFQSTKTPSDQQPTGLEAFNLTKNQNQQTPQVKELSGQDLKVGTSSAFVEQGDNIAVHYTGMFLDGKKFDSSYGKNPLTFVVGQASVIKGFQQGTLGMKIGGIRRIFIPSDLAYGSEGKKGIIPPNTPLAFDIELLEIKNKPEVTPSPTDNPDSVTPTPETSEDDEISSTPTQDTEESTE